MSLINCVNGVSTEVNRQWQIIFWITNKNKTCVVTNYWKQCKSMTHSCTDLRPHTHVEQCVHPPGKRLEMELKKVGETVQPGPEHGQASTLTSNFFACSWHFLSCHLSIYPCLFLSKPYWPLPFPIPGLITVFFSCISLWVLWSHWAVRWSWRALSIYTKRWAAFCSWDSPKAPSARAPLRTSEQLMPAAWAALVCIALTVRLEAVTKGIIPWVGIKWFGFED